MENINMEEFEPVGGEFKATVIAATVYKHPKLQGMVDIDSEQYGFHYASMSEGGLHGVQSKWGGLDERDVKLLKLCSQLNEIVREIDKLHNGEN